MNDVDSYINSLSNPLWPKNKEFLALYNYNIDELYIHDVLAQFELNKEDVNAKSSITGIFYINPFPVKLNINGKTFITFILGD